MTLSAVGARDRGRQVGRVPYRMYGTRTRRLASLLDHAGRWAGRAHVVQGDFRLDFADLVTAVRRKAAQLQEHGIGPGTASRCWGGKGRTRSSTSGRPVR